MTTSDQLIAFAVVAAIPIGVYIAGRVIEEGLSVLYKRFRGALSFKETVEGDSAILTIKSSTDVYLDQAIVHLRDRPFDLLDSLRTTNALEPNKRVELSPLDRLRIECIIQKGGDRKMFAYFYLGPEQTLIEENLEDTELSSIDFMRDNEIEIETSSRNYRRPLFNRRRDRLHRVLFAIRDRPDLDQN